MKIGAMDGQKLTALGRLEHENAEAVIARDGHVVVYLGDDERGDCLYKFVSDGIFSDGDDISRLLHEGAFFVAKFNDDGTGQNGLLPILSKPKPMYALPTIKIAAKRARRNLLMLLIRASTTSMDKFGNLWILTDGKYSNKGNFAGVGNNQMLLGNTVTGEISRFLVGPKECEVTGITWREDYKTMFVGIQHPGENGNSHFSGGPGTAPRSSIIAVTREDGGIIG